MSEREVSEVDADSTESSRELSSPAQPEKPILVFIHGSGDEAQIWRAVIAQLGADLPGATCLALDLPGHGTLVERPGPMEMSVGDYSDAVRSELTRRGIAHACLVGHSLGSAIALRLAVEHPALVSRLVLVGGGARLRVLPALLAQARERSEAAAHELATVGVAPEHADQRDAFLATRRPAAPGVLYRDLAACNEFDMMDELGHVAQPTLIVTGTEDRLTPPKYATYLHEHLDGSTLVLVPQAGHYLPIEAPVALASAICEWLPRA